MAKMLTKALNAITTAAVVVVVIATVALAGTRPFGIHPYTVLSGSMEPGIPTGSLIYVQETEPDDLTVGDVITFMVSQDTTVTHRIVEVVPDENDPSVVRYATQGDANEFPDGSLVHQENVIGVPVLCIPYLGYVADAVLTPPGSYLAVSGVAIVVMLMFLPDLFVSEKREGEEEKEGEEDEAPAKRGAHARTGGGREADPRMGGSSPAGPERSERIPPERQPAAADGRQRPPQQHPSQQQPPTRRQAAHPQQVEQRQPRAGAVPATQAGPSRVAVPCQPGNPRLRTGRQAPRSQAAESRAAEARAGNARVAEPRATQRTQPSAQRRES